MKRGTKRLWKVNGKVLGHGELVSGAGQLVREDGGGTGCERYPINKERKNTEEIQREETRK